MHPTKASLVDAAQHWIEPPDLWTGRVPARLRAAAPRVVSLPGGGDAWSFDGGGRPRPLGAELANATAQTAPGAELRATYASIRKGALHAAERLKDMALDGVEAAVVFPTFGAAVRDLADPALQLACVRAYNDALWEWCAAGDPARLIPAALLPAVGLDAALAELDRAVKMGYRGVVFAGWPAGGDQPVPEEDAFWARCEEAGLVLNLLGGGPGATRAAQDDALPPALWAQKAAPKGTNLTWLIFTGVLERFPRLKVALVEAGAGWLPSYIEQLDDMYRRGRFWAHARLTYMPSDYARRQVKATLGKEQFALLARHDLGVEVLLWASGYPGREPGTWPASRLDIEDRFRDVPEAERRRILGENCLALYGLAVPT